MNIFKRFLKIGQSEIHALVSKMENPIALTEQGLRDMKTDLQEATEQHAQVRASIIRREQAILEKQQEAQVYVEKARLIIAKTEKQEIDAAKGESLALEALTHKRDLLLTAEALQLEIEKYKSSLLEIANHMDILQTNIAKWDKELTKLKTKQKINAATAISNKKIANLDSDSTIAMLERMKAKAADQEALTDAYAELANAKLVDNQYAKDKSFASLKEELDALKNKTN